MLSNSRSTSFAVLANVDMPGPSVDERLFATHVAQILDPPEESARPAAAWQEEEPWPARS